MAACVRMCRMKISRPWPMPGLQRARPAGPEHANPRSWTLFSNRKLAIYRAWCSFPIWKTILIDFQIGNEPCIAQGDHFLFGNRSLVDFQMGNEPYIAHGHRFPIRKSTKEQVSKRKWAVSRAWRWFHIHFHSSYIGGRCDRKWRFSKGETAFAEIQFFSDISFYLHKEFPSRQTKGGDVIENVDFPKRKQRLQGYKILQRSHSTYTKITTLTICEDLSLTKCQSFLLKTLTTCEEFI